MHDQWRPIAPSHGLKALHKNDIRLCLCDIAEQHANSFEAKTRPHQTVILVSSSQAGKEWRYRT